MTAPYALSTTVARPFAETLQATREALADNGFGVLTEIDVQATMKAKLDLDVPAQVILGACRPPLAHAALQAEPSIGLLLPCNVVVREDGTGSTVVEAVNPDLMVQVTGNEAVVPIARDATTRLTAALEALAGVPSR